MILTVTLNAAWDITYRVPRLRSHTTHRVTEVVEQPGGKGLNVARVLADLGHQVTVTGFVGGPTGGTLRRHLASRYPAAPDARTGTSSPAGTDTGPPADSRDVHPSGTSDESGTGHEDVSPGRAADPPGAERRRRGDAGAPPPGRVVDALLDIDGTTRRTVAVVDDSSGDTTQLNEPGPAVGTADWATLIDRYRALLGAVDAVALCGSLPPGVPVDAYARLVREAHAARVPVLLDTSGEPLRRGIAARPDIVKPNVAELTGLTGTTEPARAARQARRRGAHAVAASLGPEGLLLVTATGAWRASPPRPVAGNPTGAGDAAVAGLLSGLVEGLTWPERLTRAVALATATVLAPTAGEFDHDAYQALLPQVTVGAA